VAAARAPGSVISRPTHGGDRHGLAHVDIPVGAVVEEQSHRGVGGEIVELAGGAHSGEQDVAEIVGCPKGYEAGIRSTLGFRGKDGEPLRREQVPHQPSALFLPLQTRSPVYRARNFEELPRLRSVETTGRRDSHSLVYGRERETSSENGRSEKSALRP